MNSDIHRDLWRQRNTARGRQQRWLVHRGGQPVGHVQIQGDRFVAVDLRRGVIGRREVLAEALDLLRSKII